MRSQFLTLLCVLTFMSCAWNIADAVVSVWQTGAVTDTRRIDRPATDQKNEKQPKNYFEDRSTGDVPMPDDPQRIRALSIAQLIYTLITLTGAILMFRLRRAGFWVYSAGIAVGIALPVALVGFGALVTSFSVFFSILFAILYWQALPEMH